MSLSSPLCQPIGDGREILNPKLGRLFAYWRSKQRGQIAPARRDIDPAEIPRLLPWVWLVDVVDGGSDFRFRIGGEKLVEFLGRRMTGETTNALASSPFFSNIAQAFAQCVRERRPILRPLARTAHEQRNYLETEAVFLPLSENGADISQIFGGFAMTSPVGDTIGRDAPAV